MKYTDHEKKQFSLAKERSKLNDLPGTIEILRNLVAENPESAMFNATLANSLKEEGDIDTAVGHFRKAVKLAPSVRVVFVSLIPLLMASGKAGRSVR